jgi:hypothetical protein
MGKHGKHMLFPAIAFWHIFDLFYNKTATNIKVLYTSNNAKTGKTQILEVFCQTIPIDLINTYCNFSS